LQGEIQSLRARPYRQSEPLAAEVCV